MRHHLWIVFALILVAGCQREEEIAVYKVPRLEPAVQEVKRESVRFLGAILPDKDVMWFYKLSGPEAAVTPLVEPFEKFVQSTRLTGKADKPITWNVAAGWEELPGNQFRHATIKIKSELEPEPLELTVTKLPRESKTAASVLANVNRWRGQVGLRAITEKDLASETKTLDVGGVQVTLVNMVGTSSPQRPMAGGDKPAPFVNPPPGGGKTQGFTVTVPAGWNEQKPNFPEITAKQYDAGNGVQVTITIMGGDGGGVDLNINRWRSEQLALPRASIDELVRLSSFIAIDGAKALITDMENPRKAGSPRIVAVIVRRPADTWFLKMSGPSEAVGRERTNFETFAKSLRFDGK